MVKYFVDVDKALDEAKVLKDCTMSAKNFAFTMGHRKWLMSIVDLLRKHLEENGPDGFTIEDNQPKKYKKKAIARTNLVQRPALLSRKRKISDEDHLVKTILNEKLAEIQQTYDDIDHIEAVDKHIEVILSKTLEQTIKSLKQPPFTSEMFDEVSL